MLAWQLAEGSFIVRRSIRGAQWGPLRVKRWVDPASPVVEPLSRPWPPNQDDEALLA